MFGEGEGAIASRIVGVSHSPTGDRSLMGSFILVAQTFLPACPEFVGPTENPCPMSSDSVLDLRGHVRW